MTCPNCGAEVTGNVCEYCGTHLESEPKNVCPHCGSRHAHFTRERRSEYLTETVGVCQDCGYSWVVSNNALCQINPMTLLWIFGWFICWSLPASVLVWRSKTMQKNLKYAIIGIFWFLYVCPFLLPWLSFWVF